MQVNALDSTEYGLFAALPACMLLNLHMFVVVFTFQMTNVMSVWLLPAILPETGFRGDHEQFQWLYLHEFVWQYLHDLHFPYQFLGEIVFFLFFSVLRNR
jgi:hypothetical protein